MIVRMKFDCEPISTNHMNGRNHKTGRTFKASKSVQFKRDIHDQLRQKYWEPVRALVEGGYGSDFVGLKNMQVPYGLVVEYTWHFPHSKILKKAKNKKSHRHIRKRNCDVNNYDKWTTDCLFEFLDIDDSYIIDMHLKKRPTELEETWFEVVIKVELLEQDEHYRDFIQPLE